MNANTLFLRFDAPLQAWGDQQSKFVIRRTAEAPTKSGVIGMLCAALGVSRAQASDNWLPRLGNLRMGVRIDQPGIRWWDYHTVGAGMRMRTAEGKTKPGAMLTRREYLCDASFLVALQGEPDLIGRLYAAMQAPVWTPYLGRKCCPPSRPILEHAPASFDDLLSALASIPWRKRLKQDKTPETLGCLLDWVPEFDGQAVPDDAAVWYDVPISFEPPAHHPRFVIRTTLIVGDNGEVAVERQPAQSDTPPPPRPRANYTNTEFKKRAADRRLADHHVCVFCKTALTKYNRTVQHVTYRRAGGSEEPEDLRSLCRLCHDAATMIEYGLGMGIDRINPEDPRWRDEIIAKRNEIIRFRSLETRRRRLAAEEVE